MTRKNRKGHEADYQGATPEDVARALHRFNPKKRPRGVREGPPKYRRPTEPDDDESDRKDDA